MAAAAVDASWFPPPHTECFGLVMNQLVSDLSGQDNLNQTCSELSLLPPLCHPDDLLLVGPALHDTDHKYIEEQVMFSRALIGDASKWAQLGETEGSESEMVFVFVL